MTSVFGRLGLRARLTVSFGALFFVLSAVLGGVTYEVTRSYLLHQREGAALRQTLSDARVVSSGIRATDVDIPSLLDSLGTRSGSDALVYLGTEVFGSSLTASPGSLPAGLVGSLSQGSVVMQRYASHGMPRLAVAARLSPDLVYVEVFPLSELSHTLRVFGGVLLGTATALTALGTVMGFAVSRGVLRPVAKVAEASARVAEGRLDTRLVAGQDRDLATLAASFNSMAESLQARIRREAAFAADVSHELRSPLTTLVTSASVLHADRERLPARDASAVELITSELTRFEHLVEDLIEIARADAEVPLDLQPVDFRVLLLEAVRRSAFADVPLEISEASYPFTVQGDKRRLERVIQNLLENAERHAGGATRVSLRAGPATVSLSVDDEGPGVPVGQRDRIFERFARGAGAEGRRGPVGSGIGLALVAEHVRMHGGRVWAEENEEGGARFVVELPRSES